MNTINFTQNEIKLLIDSETFVKKELQSRKEALLCIPIELFTLALRPLDIIANIGGNITKLGVKAFRIIKPDSEKLKRLDDSLPNPQGLWDSIVKTAKLAAAFFVSIIGVFHPATSYRIHKQLGFVNDRTPAEQEEKPEPIPLPPANEEPKAPAVQLKRKKRKKPAPPVEEKALKEPEEAAPTKEPEEAAPSPKNLPTQQDGNQVNAPCQQSQAHTAKRIRRSKSDIISQEVEKNLNEDNQPATASKSTEQTEQAEPKRKKSKLARLFSRSHLDAK